MATTSRRTLRLLSLLGTGRRWSRSDLADRLGVSERTLRRDVETLRALDYPVVSVRGPQGGYRLRRDQTLPPLLLDEDQALAVALALQTAPTTVFGLGDEAARALTSLTQTMPTRLRTAMESLRVVQLHNYWEFSTPPITPDALTAVGRAVRHRELLTFDLLRPDGTRPGLQDADFTPPRRIEPHHLVVWAGRWYLVGPEHGQPDWTVLRVDRIHPHAPTGTTFEPRPVPGGDVGELVRTRFDRGDTPAPWQCVGSARIAVPAEVVARWAPGGSVVEQLDAAHSRLTVGAWSWAGVVGLLATFDAELTEVEPAELVAACRRLADRWQGM